MSACDPSRQTVVGDASTNERDAADPYAAVRDTGSSDDPDAGPVVAADGSRPNDAGDDQPPDTDAATDELDGSTVDSAMPDGPVVPDTLLLSGPAGESADRDVTIVVSSNVEGASYRCWFDGVELERCEATTMLADLALGEHRFRIAAIDGAGVVDPTPLNLRWAIVEPPPIALSQVSTGYNHACIIDVDGALLCWGSNAFGQLGLGDTDERSEATRVGNDNDWEAIALGRFHSCGLRNGGALYCWGASAFGQAGSNEDAITTPDPVPAPQGSWTAITAGEWHSCGLTTTAVVYCWGYNLLGRLGDGHGAGTENDPEASVAQPTAVALPDTPVAVSAGAAHSCALGDQGELWCWGSNAKGELGSEADSSCSLSDSAVECSLLPAAVSGEQIYRSVSAGGSHTCAIDDEGALWCWGSGQYGELGSGDHASAAQPRAVEGAYAHVACGAFHTCALRDDEGLVCFGDNANGQLGYGMESSTQPVSTGADRSWSALSAGMLGSCAIDDAGLGYCWGLSAYSSTALPSLIARAEGE